MTDSGLLDPNRPYKLIQDAVAIQSDEWKARLKLLSDFFNVNQETNLDEFFDKMTNYIKNDPDERWTSIYFHGIFLNNIEIRPKYAELYLNILERLYKLFPQTDYLTCYTSERHYIRQLLYRRGFFGEELVKNFDNIPTYEELISIYQPESIQVYLRDDDIQHFQEYVLQSSGFDFNMQLPTASNSPIRKIHSDSVSLAQFAAFYGSLKCFKYILLNDVTLDDDICKFAVAGGNIEIIHILEQKECQFKYPCFYTSIQYHRNDIADWLLLHYNCEEVSLIDCLNIFNEEAFVFFLENCKDVNAQDYLAFSCYTGNYYVINALLKHGANIHQGKNPAIINACYKGYLVIVKLLLENGANINQMGDLNTPLSTACERSRRDVVKFLVEKGADVNLLEKHKRSPLSISCSQGDVESVRVLLDHGALIDNGAEYPLINASTNGSLEIVKMLVEKGADVNKLDSNGNTPLSITCSNNNIAIINYLIDHNADVNQGNALYNACENGNLEVAKLLIEKGANVNKGPNTPLCGACEKGYYDIVKLLIDNGANVNRGNDHNNPLLIACSKNYIKIAKLLIENGADVNKQVDNGFDGFVSPLSVACTDNLIDIAKLLIDKGANFKRSIKLGFDQQDTPLTIALDNKAIDVAEYLVSKGATEIDIYAKLDHLRELLLQSKMI